MCDTGTFGEGWTRKSLCKTSLFLLGWETSQYMWKKSSGPCWIYELRLVSQTLHWQHSQCRCINWFMRTDPTAFLVVCSHYHDSRPHCARAVVCIPTQQTRSGNRSRWNRAACLGFVPVHHAAALVSGQKQQGHKSMNEETHCFYRQLSKFAKPPEKPAMTKNTSGERSWTRWGTSHFSYTGFSPFATKPWQKGLNAALNALQRF